VPDLAALQERQAHLIRKALNGGAWLGDKSVAAPTALTTGPNAAPQPLPVGYEDCGMILKDDGLAFASEVETSDTMSWGVAEPTRRDIVSDVDTVTWTMQETKRLTLEVYHGLDLSGLTPTPETGEVAFSKPTTPQTIHRRWMAIAQDGVGADAIYLGRFHPRMGITGKEELAWKDGQETQYKVTGTAFQDPVLGYSTRFFFGGPGWRALLADMGFPALTP
jgi:hypothetical protein